MLALLLLQAAAPQTAVEAERAFARAAQAKGQWTAFREFAAPDATMFVPQPVNAQEWLKDREDPPKSVEWWPTESYVSCDGTVAVNTGGWKRPDGTVGYFTTVWLRDSDGTFKWVVDGGATLSSAPPPTDPVVVRPDCTRAAQQFVPAHPGPNAGIGYARDATLDWEWRVARGGSRNFRVRQWNGSYLKTVLEQRVAAPAK